MLMFIGVVVVLGSRYWGGDAPRASIIVGGVSTKAASMGALVVRGQQSLMDFWTLEQ
jgi:hypothetical protein